MATSNDGSYITQTAHLQETRHRRTFTFAAPIRVALSSGRNGRGQLLEVVAAEGVEDEGGDDAQAFLALDVLVWGDDNIPLELQAAVGVYVRREYIVSAQVQAPSLRTPRSIRDVAAKEVR